MSKYSIENRPTKPFTDQKPGTSGLRKPTKTFKKDQYFENFIQAYFDDLNQTNKDKQTTLVVGGDGRHFVREGTRIIIQMAAANNVRQISLRTNSILQMEVCLNCDLKQKRIFLNILIRSSSGSGNK